MRTLPIIILAFLLIVSNKVQSQVLWTLDHAHSNLRFTITHLMVSEIDGTIKMKEGTITTLHDDFSDASLNIVGDMKTIDTDNDARDEHLKTPDFFDVEKYPLFTFQSTSFKKIDEHHYTVSGQLTFHGITKLVALDAVANVGVNPYDNKTLVGFKVTGTIKRSDYNISADSPSAVVSDDVAIKANVEFIKNQ